MLERYQNLIKNILELEKENFCGLEIAWCRTLYNLYVIYTVSTSLKHTHTLESRIKTTIHTLIGYLM